MFYQWFVYPSKFCLGRRRNFTEISKGIKHFSWENLKYVKSKFGGRKYGGGDARNWPKYPGHFH